MTNQHPQPAFALMNSLPIPAEDSFLLDWYGLRKLTLNAETPLNNTLNFGSATNFRAV